MLTLHVTHHKGLGACQDCMSSVVLQKVLSAN